MGSAGASASVVSGPVTVARACQKSTSSGFGVASVSGPRLECTQESTSPHKNASRPILGDHCTMFSQLQRTMLSGAVFLGLGVLGWSLGPAVGQEPANPSPSPNPTQGNPQAAHPQAANAPSPRYGVTPDYVQPQAHQPHRRRSIVHHYPYPYPGAYHNDDTAGFRNPGGVDGMPNIICPATGSRSSKTPSAWPGSTREATPAGPSNWPPNRSAFLDTTRSSSTSITMRCPASATVLGWEVSAASGDRRGRIPQRLRADQPERVSSAR